MPSDISVLEPGDYPETLANMPCPPERLYIRGSLPDPKDRKYLCVVGARAWSPYGRDAVRRVLSGLAGYPITIVSGLAYGIDSIAHVEGMAARLHCLAFPGSSLDWDELYPREHMGLAQAIVSAGGALASRWQPGYATGPWAFPARNVLMAGISHATMVVEAARHSGSLLTAQHALDFGRDVLAIPGPIGAGLSYGPNMLIRRGAIPITSSEDILEALGCSISKTGGLASPALADIDPLSRKLLELAALGHATPDMMIERTGAPAADVLERLTALELRGAIEVAPDAVRLL